VSVRIEGCQCQPGCIRVATFNVHFGKDSAAIAGLFKENENLAQVDVLLIQEIEHRTKEKLARTARVARALGWNYVYVPNRELNRGRGTHGIAVLSHMPIENTAPIQLPFYPTPQPRPRVAVGFEVTVNGKPVKIFNVHLSGALNFEERIQQLATVVQSTGTVGSTPVILGGDFNTVPLLMLGRTVPVFFSNQKEKVYAYLEDAGFATTCRAAGHTFRVGPARFQLDGVYAKNAAVVKFGVERGRRISDHYPLWADVRVEEAA
jgi:endonuclease/exonuclease/phosphatase family metal-dependent hydrolase